MVILPVDQGFEHGPARSFAPNPPAYDPRYHFELAIEAGCNAYAAPLGFLEAGAAEFAGEIPLILKLNNHDVLHDEADPISSVTGSVHEALRLGCAAIGFTIYPGSANAGRMYEQIRGLAEEAKTVGLAVVVWSYPRGSMISKAGETGIDVVAYAAQIAAQLGAHVIKVKLPTDHVEQDEAKKVYQKQAIPIGTLAERVRHVVQSSFDGRRIVIFSGGAKKDNDDDVIAEAQAIRDGGGFGSIIEQLPEVEAQSGCYVDHVRLPGGTAAFLARRAPAGASAAVGPRFRPCVPEFRNRLRRAPSADVSIAADGNRSPGARRWLRGRAIAPCASRGIRRAPAN
jgi:class I fructose-bisphosphate aldolase